MTIDFANPSEIKATIIGMANLAVRQFDHTRNGEIVLQDGRGSLTAEDRLIMSRISGHALVLGEQDIASSIHDLLFLMTTPFSSWPVSAFRTVGPEFSEVTLIEPVTLVPSMECRHLVAEGGNIDTAVEEVLFQNFRDALEQTARKEAPQAYTFIRGLISRNPLTDEAALIRLLDDAGFSALYSEVRGFYEPVHHTPGLVGQVIPCGYCGSRMATELSNGTLRCPLRQCRDQKPTLEGTPRPTSNGLLGAKAAILTYWVGPAQDELKIYDAAIAAGIPSVLYDKLDACDIFIDGHIGIDVKSYRSPIMLAQKFNRDGVGGLKRYRTQVLAISDDLIKADPDYIKTLKAHLNKDLGIEIMSVSTTIRRYVDA
ncbi:MAG: hypothetical protein OQK35_02845 [Alphaproteobacteria bacterium]|nr:hypothetical protein [Alphaproteobacteria bacterium]